MKSIIRTQSGGSEAKHVIAKRAFDLVIDRLERFTESAADEKQLQSQLDFILENQILVEAP